MRVYEPTCEHCEQLADAAAEVWGDVTAWNERELVSQPREYIALAHRVDASTETCRCRCHIPARISGKMPRLPVAEVAA